MDDAVSSRPVHKFADLKLSARTLKGLSAAGFLRPTEIQALVIPRALAGEDVVASAKTGSGKTLAFVVPALELLHRDGWCRDLGLGVLIISPTRELAYQIFREVRRVGAKHNFSLGLITGGYHDVKEQGARVGRMSILIATPGRIVQHLSERPDLSADNLKLLVLDEADRILHLGFKAELDALLEYLPSTRQTLLFSATQTRSVQDLVRLKMREPVTVDTGRESAMATPDSLRQAYVRCLSVGDKPRFLWQFITGNRMRKCIVFFATCKQVRFFYELTLKLRPGVRVLQLHGGMTQRRRTAVYDEFGRVKHAVLLCTDLASRGLDFPDVDSVLQLDCPPDLRTYVHRVGRTARLSRSGRAVVLLLAWEADVLPRLLGEMRPPVRLEAVQPRQLPVRWDILAKVAGLVAADPELRAMAERAVRAYVKTYACFAELKQVFRADQLDLMSLAQAHGLVKVPRMPRSVLARGVRLPSRANEIDGGESESDGEDENRAEAGDGDDFLLPKTEEQPDELAADGDGAAATRRNKKKQLKAKEVPKVDVDAEAVAAEVEDSTQAAGRRKKALTRARLAKRILAKGIRPFQRTTFDEAGEVVADPRKPAASIAEASTGGGLAIDEAKRQLAEADAGDKQLYRELLRRQHREAKAKAKRSAAEAAAAPNPVFRSKRARLVMTAEAGSDEGDSSAEGADSEGADESADFSDGEVERVDVGSDD